MNARVDILPDGRRRVVEPYRLVVKKTGLVIDFEPGFTSDYSSIPTFVIAVLCILFLGLVGWKAPDLRIPAGLFAIWVLRAALVRFDRVTWAGLVHDALYQDPEGRSRRQCDLVWPLVAMQGTRRAGWDQAWFGYIGLRAGGWWAWRKHRKNDGH